ncbi:MAG: hypothetical protein PHT12_01210 [Patescibacteria group bacterium]|nr:hypothetical protein [Patescibacteria group bacterium]
MTTLVDRANWRGVIVESEAVNGGSVDPRLRHEGVQYVTEGELLLAKLLCQMSVAFTPNVKFLLAPSGNKPPRGRIRFVPVIYVPDFVFNRLGLIWTNEDGTTEIVHGLEAKSVRSHFKPQALRKARLLAEQRSIHIKLLSETDIRRYAALGTLPIIRL